MSYKKAVARNKRAGKMFGETFNPGQRSAPRGEDLAKAQARQAKVLELKRITETWRERHEIGVSLAREIMAETIADYRAASDPYRGKLKSLGLRLKKAIPHGGFRFDSQAQAWVTNKPAVIRHLQKIHTAGWKSLLGPEVIVMSEDNWVAFTLD